MDEHVCRQVHHMKSLVIGQLPDEEPLIHPGGLIFSTYSSLGGNDFGINIYYFFSFYLLKR